MADIDNQSLTSVNPQITDSVTQTKACTEIPASTVGNLYQAIAQSLSIAAQNAVNAQQQIYITMQAATTMGVANLYNLDTASTGVSAGPAPQLDEAMKLLQSSRPAPESMLIAEATGNADDAAAPANNEFANHIRSVADTFAESLENFSDIAYIQLLQTIQLAATAATLAELIKAPDLLQSYERVLETIKNLR